MSLPLVVYGMMMSDAARNGALARAIRAAVRPGDVVADVGSGVGFLSLLAARAGAKVVYALESSEWADVAPYLAKLNNFANIIKFVKRGTSFDWAPPEPADVVICETLGYAVLDEGFRATMSDARDRMLRPGGRLIPQRVDIMAVPVSRCDTMIDPEYLETAEGLDLGPFADMYRKLYQRALIPRSAELAPPQILFSMDCHAMDAHSPLRAQAHFDLEGGRVPAGIALWFSAALTNRILLESRDPSPTNHWGQTLLPLHHISDVPGPHRLDLTIEIADRQKFAIRWATELKSLAGVR